MARGKGGQAGVVSAEAQLGRWTKIQDVATGALIGSVVAIILTPVSQGLTYYLSQFLSRAVLSIEYVEKTPADRSVKIDNSATQRLLQSPSFASYIASNPNARILAVGLSSNITANLIDGLRDTAQRLMDEINRSLQKIEQTDRQLVSASNGDEISKLAQDYHGALYSSFPYAGEPPERVKALLLAQLQIDRPPLAELIFLCKAVVDSLQAARIPISDFALRVSVLNRGDTDGLIRSTGEMELAGLSFPIPLLRTTPPRDNNVSQTGLAVQVAVMNQPESPIREQSVGKIEKHAMVEFWFAVDELKLSKEQLTVFRQQLPLPETAKFRLVLADQELKKITYQVSPR